MRQLTTLVAAIAVVSMFSLSASAELEIGGDLKVLGVYTDNTRDFDDDNGRGSGAKGYYSSGNDDQDDFLRIEAHLWFDADLSDNVTTRVSLEVDRDLDQSDTENSRASSNVSSDLTVFLEEAWIQAAYLFDSEFSLKGGRQFIELGDGFVIGDAQPSSEAGGISDLGEYEQQPFDALVLTYDRDDWMLTLVGAKVVETRSSDRDADLLTAYFSYLGIEDMEIDAYVGLGTFDGDHLDHFAGLAGGGSSHDKGPVDSVTGGDIWFVGLRIAGEALANVEGLSYKLEGVYEFGDIEVAGSGPDPDVKAWAVEAGINYAFDADYNPYVGFTYVYQSGDDGPSDSDFETYLALFENRTYGEIFDPFTNGNIHIFNLNGGLDLTEDISLSGSYYYFLADEDSVGHSLQQNWGGDDDLGHEFDVYLDYAFTEETTAVLAGGLFIPQDGVEKGLGGGRADDEAWMIRGGVEVNF